MNDRNWRLASIGPPTAFLLTPAFDIRRFPAAEFRSSSGARSTQDFPFGRHASRRPAGVEDSASLRKTLLRNVPTRVFRAKWQIRILRSPGLAGGALTPMNCAAGCVFSGSISTARAAVSRRQRGSQSISAAGFLTMIFTGVRSSRSSFVKPGAPFGGSHRRTQERGCVRRGVSIEALVQPVPAKAERYLITWRRPCPW